MKQSNPYAISFGKIPNLFIGRDILVNDVVDRLNNNPVQMQAIKLTGVRGSGKTVTMSAIEGELKKDSTWIIINLNPYADLLLDLTADLYSSETFLTKFIDANLNLSAFGIGLNISKKSPAASIRVVLKTILEEVRKKKKKVLVTIDEVHKTEEVINFIQEFQILIRNDLPIYLIVAGLYEDIEDVENSEGLTFFLRAMKYDMGPLNIGIIREDYKKTLNVSYETADELAVMSKGYAFAYQAIGMYMWESKEKQITPMVLAQVDNALEGMVYEKIWSELTPKDRWYLRYIVQKDRMTVSELLEITKKNHNEWSKSRKHLIAKGILDGTMRGEIAMRLPRMKEFIDTHHTAQMEELS